MFLLYKIATGKALSQSSSEPLTLPEGTAIKEVDSFDGSWNETTLSFDPLPIDKKMSTLAFMELFTEAELIGILDAAKVSTQVQLFVMKMEQAEFMDLNYQPTIDGVNGLAVGGLLTPERATVIING